MSAAESSLVSYGSDSDSENESKSGTSPERMDTTDPDATAHLKPLQTGPIMALAVLNSAPEVAVKVSYRSYLALANCTQKYSGLFAAVISVICVNTRYLLFPLKTFLYQGVTEITFGEKKPN